MDTAEDLKQDLLRRWRAQFDRIAFLAEAAERGVRTVYATGPLFDLEKYSPRKFPAGGRTSKEPIQGCDNWVYRLDNQGRPVHMAVRHDFSKTERQGIYSYASEEAVYTEFFMQGHVPSTYERITLGDGQPVNFQRLWLNGNGFPLREIPRDRQEEWIMGDPGRYQIVIKGYDSQDGRIQSGWVWVEGGRGFGPYRSRLEYSYSNEGKLERMVKRWEDGRAETVFAARTKTGIKELSTKLSRRIAERVIDALQRASFNPPLVAAELPYHSVTSYIPSIVPGTQADFEGLKYPSLVAAIDRKRWIELREEDFAPEIAEFMERMNSSERWEPGTKMLREAARTVTEFGRGQSWAAEDFVAFAIDWEFEGRDLAKILKDCGADRRALKRWKNKGWI